MEIYQLIDKERERQDRLHPLFKTKATDNKDLNAMQHLLFLHEMVAILGEEYGEVCKAVQEGTNLQEELIQVASVCVRWLERIKTS
jgi:NTP pyrophosphatase (non-canonical NTP hydrolase)